MKHTIYFLSLLCVSLMVACSPADGNRPGHEFMPDMVHTIGYEANLYNYYYYNRWGTEEEYKSYAMPRLSVPGTVARGQITIANAADDASRMASMEGFSGEGEGSVAFIPNGMVPYYYTDTEEERLTATREISRNPFPITEAGLEHGKVLYDIYCGICHGESGNGQGYLVREDDPGKGIIAGVYPAAPANLLQDTFINASPGRIYHAIMFGKNVMAPYSDKLNYQERWEVIHYIRSLQAKEKKLEYTATVNSFNREATPWATLEPTLNKKMVAHPDTMNLDGNAHDAEGHNMNEH